MNSHLLNDDDLYFLTYWMLGKPINTIGSLPSFEDYFFKKNTAQRSICCSFLFQVFENRSEIVVKRLKQIKTLFSAKQKILDIPKDLIQITNEIKAKLRMSTRKEIPNDTQRQFLELEHEIIRRLKKKIKTSNSQELLEQIYTIKSYFLVRDNVHLKESISFLEYLHFR